MTETFLQNRLKLIELDRQLELANKELASVRQVMADAIAEPELQALAIAEIAELETKISRLNQQRDILLLPSDPLDEKSVFLEITANDDTDANYLWVLHLLRMYCLYGDTQNWKSLLISEDVAEKEGLKRVLVAIEGDGVYGKLKLETGIHQSEGNSQSTEKDSVSATVTVIPQVNSVEMPIAPADVKVYDRRSTNCRCNLCVCKTEFGVQIIHQPRGMRITCTEEGSQQSNKDRAMQILRAKLHNLKLTGNRPLEIIRTYDCKNNLVCDRRLNQSFSLADVLEGNMEEILQSCILQDKQEKLKPL